METYLSVGTNQILMDLHQPIKNGQSKPTGGLWATIHDTKYPNYNPWIDFLTYHPHILFYKGAKQSPLLIPATLITLKESANIFLINNHNQLEFLKKYYPSKDGWIDFEKISNDFDGIFIDLKCTFSDITLEDKEKIATFAVSSLIIFNLGCIKHYQKATVDITEFDCEFQPELVEYTIKIDNELQHVTASSPELLSLINKIKKQEASNTPLLESDINNRYNEILTRLTKDFKSKYNYSQSTSTLKHLLIRHIARSI